MPYTRPRRAMTERGEQRYRTRVEARVDQARQDAEVERRRAEMERASAEARAPAIKGYAAAKAKLDEMNRMTDREGKAMGRAMDRAKVAKLTSECVQKRHHLPRQ